MLSDSATQWREGGSKFEAYFRRGEIFLSFFCRHLETGPLTRWKDGKLASHTKWWWCWICYFMNLIQITPTPHERHVENQKFHLCPPQIPSSPHNPCYIWRICDLAGKVGSLIASATLPGSCHKIDLRGGTLLPWRGGRGLTRPPSAGGGAGPL